MTDRSRERGEGRLGSIIGLLVLGAIVLAAWNVVPVYIANYDFKDKLNELARMPRGMTSDDAIRNRIMQEASKRRLDTYLTRQGCTITTRENSRVIECEYQREVEVLPGWKHVFHFKPSADQPLI